MRDDCSSLPPAAPDEEYASYAVLLWPAMAIMIDLDRAGSPPGTRYPLFELTKDDTIAARNIERVALGEAQGTDTPRISIRVP